MLLLIWFVAAFIVALLGFAMVLSLFVNIYDGYLDEAGIVVPTDWNEEN